MVELKPGDVFASRNPQSLGKAINWLERLRSHDNEATYGHTGIIIKPDGTTVEAVWSITSQNLFKDYKGTKVLIARPVAMNPEAYAKGFDAIKCHIGTSYPYYRLLMHFLGIGKFVHFKTPVCSELTAKFLINAGIRCLSGQNYWGVNPDNLVDEWRISDHFDVIFEGVIE